MSPEPRLPKKKKKKKKKRKESLGFLKGKP
jgi:hypothetical protein